MKYNLAFVLSKNTLIKTLLPTLFIIFTLNLSSTDTESLFDTAYFLPGYISFLSINITYLVILFFSVFGVFFLLRKKTIPFIPIAVFSSAYGVLFLHSLVYGNDVARYAVLFAMPLFFISGLYYFLRKVSADEAVSLFPHVLWGFLLISCYFSLMNFSIHPRISGYIQNPNAFGMTVFGSMVLYHVSVRKLGFLGFVYFLSSFLLVVLTGSRLSLGVTFIALPFLIFGHITLSKSFYLLLGVGVAIAIFYFLPGNIDMHRAFDFSSSITDSGRSIYWLRAWELFKANMLTGVGADVSSTVGTGNVHNSYLRVMVMTGLLFSLLFFFFFFFGIFLVVMDKRIGLGVKAFFLSIPLLFFAEDYVVSIVSTYSFFMSIFLLYAWKRKDDLACVIKKQTQWVV